MTDVRLYLVTDRHLAAGRDLVEIVSAAVAGGVTLVQLRDKTAPDHEVVELAVRLLDVLRPTGVSLVLNDRPDLAMLAGADGVHVGQGDASVQKARRIMGPEAIVGLSVENLSQVAQAESLDVDYYGVSPVFRTPTKTDTAPPWGLDGLSALRRITTRPLVAIGGIHLDNGRDVLAAGADGLAVVSAIISADDPGAAAAGLRALFT